MAGSCALFREFECAAEMEWGVMSAFGWADYWKMFKSKGPRLPLCYFLNAHLFDLINKTDTHTRLSKDQFQAAPENFEHGVFYMVSWNSEISMAFGVLKKLLPDFEQFSFVDIGCGKGKVMLVWQKLLNRYSLSQKILGIEYYEPFIEIARSNYQCVFSAPGNFICADATKIDYSVYGDKIIIYLYNPFDDTILSSVINSLKNKEIYVIYNNPVHSSVLSSFGFDVIHRHSGFHPNSCTTIFKRILSV